MRMNRKTLVYCLLILVFAFTSQPAFSATKIDLNTATVAQLVTLKGIGEKTAVKIVDYRKKHKFTTVDELLNVKGVGEKTLKKIRNQVTVAKKKKKTKKKK